jgi:hypothetical protein
MQITSFETIEGRKLLKQIYFELKFQKTINSFSMLFIMWRIIVNKNNLHKYSEIDVDISYSLGVIKGTFLWIEEVFIRYYFTVLNALIYFGAAILLLLVGLRKFSNLISDTTVIMGFVLEASLLIMMFIFLLFSPKDDLIEEIQGIDSTNADSEELINEIGEIARDFADASLKLGYINQNLAEIHQSQKMMINQLVELTRSFHKLASPNDEMLQVMQSTNQHLSSFEQNIESLNKQLSVIQSSNIEFEVKKQVQEFLTSKLINEKAAK